MTSESISGFYSVSLITTAEHPEECQGAGSLNTWFMSEFGVSFPDAPRAAVQSTCFDQEPWRNWEERSWHDTCWLVRQIKAFKKKWLWGWSMCFHFHLSQNASKVVSLISTFKSMLHHKNMKNTVWVHVFEALQFGPLLLLPSLLAVITVVIAGRWRIHPQVKQRKEGERGAHLCSSLLSGKPSAIGN